jgi:nicotinamidase-related amidase
MAPRIDRSRLGLFVIDVQPVFLDLAFAGRDQAREALMTRLEHLLMLAAWMDLPTIATFEIPTSRNGELPDRLERVLPAAARRFEKNFFGALSEAAIERAVGALTVRQFAVAGAETDVCVLQTTLGLLDLGYEVFLLEDCLFTTERRPGPALRRMYRAGAIPCTLKTLAYELTGCVDELPWYPDDWALKGHPDAKPFPDRFVAPEEWPDWEPGYG